MAAAGAARLLDEWFLFLFYNSFSFKSEELK